MRRLYALAAALGLMLGAVGAHAATDNATETFSVDVDAIVEFITTKQTSSATANISNWDVDDASNGDESTATVIFRLVMNTDTTLTGVFDGPLTNTSTGEFLLTYANIQADGDGATAVTAGADGHNATTDLAHTGFLSAAHDADQGVGLSGGGTAFGYIGGLATLASSGATPADDAGVAVYGTLTEQFLDDATGVTLTHISQDGAVLLTVMVRGFNGEDYGAASDFTEAPDTGTYTCDLTLTATSI